jgi:hypothetical protein
MGILSKVNFVAFYYNQICAQYFMLRHFVLYLDITEQQRWGRTMDSQLKLRENEETCFGEFFEWKNLASQHSISFERDREMWD